MTREYGPSLSLRLPPLAPALRLAWRRSRRDAWMVVASIVVVALAAVLAYAGPRAVAGTLDEGAADAVRSAGADATITATVPVGNPAGDNVSSLRGLATDEFGDAVATMHGALPPAVSAVVAAPYAWSVSSSQQVESVTPAAGPDDDSPPEPIAKGDANVFLALVPGASIEVIEGTEPVFDATQGPAGQNMPAPSPIQVALTEPVASALGVSIGDVLSVRHVGDEPVDLLVTGIGTVSGSPQGAQALPTLDEPETFFAGTAQERVDVTVLLSPEAAAAFTARTRTPFTGTVTWETVPAELTMDGARAIPGALAAVTASPELLLPEQQVIPQLTTRLGDVLADYPTRARAALAQMSVVVAGVVAAASAVVLLMARLLLAGRQRDIELERARGGSVASTTLALAVEALGVTLIGVALGFTAAAVMTEADRPLDPLVGVVAIVAIVAPTALGIVRARAAWAGKREGANRVDRAKVASARKARALTRDGVVILIAAIAVVALRTRGLTTTTSTSVDPLLAAGPVLVTLAATLLVLRLVVLPLRVTQAIAARTRGTAGLLALARARGKVTALPVTALSLAIGVAAAGSLLTSTVTSGQERASWERVGAQARVEATVDAATLARLADAGLAGAPLYVAPYSTLALGKNIENATVVAVGDDYPDILDEAGYAADAGAIRALLAASKEVADGEPLPALTSREIQSVDVYGSSQLFAGNTYVPFASQGDAIDGLAGWVAGPYVIVSLTALQGFPTDDPIEADVTLVGGADAAAAIAASEIDPHVVTTREAWLDTARGSALIGGVQRVMATSVTAVAALAIIALLVGVVTGSKERSRALALLRTQGVGGRYGWWLAAVDLLPTVASAVISGALGAAAVVILLSSSLGLDVLAGGTGQPAVTLPSTHLALGLAGVVALTAVAILAEVVAQGRAKLSEVLRYGETR